MTLNQLLECVLGKSCVLEGKFGDSTAFASTSMGVAKEYCERLGMHGFEPTGKEPLFNGMTGEYMGEVFIGPVYYQRLKHLVSDKIHMRATGPNATLTRQPLEGRSRAGGKLMPQWYVIILLVCITTGNITKFRGTLKCIKIQKHSVLSQCEKSIDGSGENSEVKVQSE
jgi:hypothetical protein